MLSNVTAHFFRKRSSQTRVGLIGLLGFAISISGQVRAEVKFAASLPASGFNERHDAVGFEGLVYPATSSVSHNFRFIQVRDSWGNGIAYRASFDCSRSYGLITNMICETPLLSRLDYQLAARFSRLDTTLNDGQNRKIHHKETQFLNLRQACSDSKCIQAIYVSRIKELDNNRFK